MAPSKKRKRNQQPKQKNKPNHGKSNKKQQTPNLPATSSSGVTSRPMLMRTDNYNAVQGVEFLDRYVHEMIEIVPADLYIVKENEDDGDWQSRKFRRNGKNDAPKQKLKESSQKGRKRAKFETTEYKSVAETQSQVLSQAAKSDDGDAGSDDNQKNQPILLNPDRKPASSFEELKERVRMKIAASRESRTSQKKNRPEKKKPTPGDAKKKKNKRPAVDANADPKKRKAPANSTNPVETTTNNNNNSAENNNHNDNLDKVHDNLVSSLSKISYGNLDLAGDGKTIFDGTKARAVENQKARTKLDVKKLIKQAESNQERIEQLKKSTDGNLIDADDKLFENMEKKALGMKVKDDPKQLKKTLKRIERKKEKSRDAWSHRLERENKEKNDKLDKRDANVASQNKKKLESKLKRKGIAVPKEKAPRRRAGFEGKHKGFINDSAKAGKDGKEAPAAKGGKKKKH